MKKFHSSVVFVMTTVTSPKTAKKKAKDEQENEKNQWTQIQKSGPPNQKNGKDGKAKNGNAHKSNKFVVLTKESAILEGEMHESAILEEGKMHDAEEQIFEDEANPSLMVTPGAVYTDVPKYCELQQNTSPNGIKYSPSYVEITKKKPVDISSSSDEDSIEKTSKKGRKS